VERTRHRHLQGADDRGARRRIKLKLIPVSFVQRFPALQAGTIDVIVRTRRGR
jgi:ABC-type amino acid transport substrate-binding protein